MADTKNHVRESILKEDGSKDIYYKQNTAQDVLLHDGTDEDIRGHIVFYATCATAADVAAKEISLNDGTTDVLRGQAYVSVTFENGNTAEAITLSINGGTAYNVDGATSTSIAAGNTVILIFDGSKFIVASGAGATKIKNVNITEGSTRYVGLVEGETDNGQVEYDDSIKITEEGLEAKVGKSTVDFTPDAEQLNTDTREANKLTSGLALKDIVRKVWNIIAGLGSLAFRSSVGTAQLDSTLAEDYNLTVHKSGTINGAAVNDLYNGTDFSGTVGTKALDAAAGATLQNSITTLNSKVDTNTNSISKFGSFYKDIQTVSGTDFNNLKSNGIFMGTNMKNDPCSSQGTWYFIDVKVHNSNWVVQTACNFNMSTTAPTYVRSCFNGDWKAWRLFNPGTANTAQVLSGYTFSSANGVNLSGSMKSYTSGNQSVTTSGKWGFDTTNGAWIYIPTTGYYTTSYWLNIPYNTFKSNVNFSPQIKYKTIGAENKGSYIKTPSITITQTGTYILCMGGKIMYTANGDAGNQYGRLWVGSSEPSYNIQRGAATVLSGGGCFSATNPITISANTVVYAWMDASENHVDVSGEYNEMYLLVIGV